MSQPNPNIHDPESLFNDNFLSSLHEDGSKHSSSVPSGGMNYDDVGKFDQGMFQKHPMMGVAVFILLPWSMFVLTMWPFALGYRHIPGFSWIVFSFFIVCSAVILWGGTKLYGPLRQYWWVIGFVCLISTVIGMLLGLYDYNKNTFAYHTYEGSRSYSNVLPAEDPGMMLDIGTIEFSSDATVDYTRSVGYKHGDLYCVAPVFSVDTLGTKQGSAPTINYWAAGLDCCEERANFWCGPIQDESVQGGLVILDVSPIAQKLLPNYLAAVHQASVAYGLKVPESPMIVKWTRNKHRAHIIFWYDGVDYYRRCVWAYLVVYLIASAICVHLVTPVATLKTYFGDMVLKAGGKR